MAGRKPKSAAEKKLHGNPGKRALNEREPIPPDGPVKRPYWVKGKATWAWRRLVPVLSAMKVLTPSDVDALGMLCQAYADWVELIEILKKEGRTYKTKNTMGGRVIKIRPEVELADTAFKRVKVLLVEFGLTPGSRSRIKTQPVKEADPLAELLNRRKGLVAIK